MVEKCDLPKEMSAGTAPSPKIYEVDDAGRPVEPVLDTPEGQWVIDDSDEEEEALLHEPTAEEMLEHIQDERMGRRTEMTLDWLIWTMPFAFAFILMDVLVQQQYGEKPTIWGECKTFVTRVPGTFRLCVGVQLTRSRAGPSCLLGCVALRGNIY